MIFKYITWTRGYNIQILRWILYFCQWHIFFIYFFFKLEEIHVTLRNDLSLEQPQLFFQVIIFLWILYQWKDLNDSFLKQFLWKENYKQLNFLAYIAWLDYQINKALSNLLYTCQFIDWWQQ